MKTQDAITPDQEEQYYDQAIGWDEEIFRKERKSKQRWRIISYVFAGIALTAVVALAGLTPLKTAVPYVVKVEKTTGIVEVINPLEQREVTQEEALTKHFIVQYLNAREQYDFQDREENYEIVGKMSSEKCFAEYRREYDPSNPQSPLNLYGDNVKVTYHVRDLALIDEDTALVHIKRKVHRANTLTESYWLITLTYQWVMEPKSESDRHLNPLGFLTTHYRRDQEIIEEIEIKR
jgi:type IV secretion system protein VirB8